MSSTGKKRGRKPKVVKADSDPNLEEKKPKKRGRKPKVKKEDSKEPVKPKGKRGRKPKEKYVAKTEPVVEDDCLFLELKGVHPSQIKKTSNLFMYNPNLSEPQPFDLDSTQMAPLQMENPDMATMYRPIVGHDMSSMNELVTPQFEDDSSNLVNNDSNLVIPENIEYKPLDNMEPNDEEEVSINVYQDYDKLVLKRKINKLKLKYNTGSQSGNTRTNVYCFWDSHPFENDPWCIPTKKVGDTYFVDGNFCSASCAASYLFDEMPFDAWERFELLNLMYKETYGLKKIHKITLTPPKRSLKIYGGPLSIEEFRQKSLAKEPLGDKEGKSLNPVEIHQEFEILRPPMVPVTPQLVEINYEKVNMEKSKPISGPKLKVERKKVVQKRDKPLHNKNKTLIGLMGIVTNDV